MRSIVHTLAPLVLLAAIACGGSDPAGPAPPSEPDPVVDPALSGVWLGTIRGSGNGMSGSANIRFELDASGFMSVSVSNLPFHEIPSGSWGVVNDEFRASGTDTEGGRPSFAAPRSETRLQGTWQSAGSSGTFDVTKE
ncbi:MAG: hypothetical protein PVF05_10955 [Gemmatimonadales bacterium]|jgi:hypothetical protein